MWFKFKADTPEEIERKRRAEEAIAALERGEVLPQAKHRIEHFKAGAGKAFSTDMTTKEFLLTEECGIEPLGQVMGTCFYRLGMYASFVSSRRTGEIYEIAGAHRASREAAVNRMKAEAALYGADGIVSVRLKSTRQDYGTGLIEFTAIGTAVKVHGWEKEDLEDGLFTCELSAQEFWQLIHAGYRPCNIVYGISSYYVNSDVSTRNLVVRSALWNRGNQEIRQWTTGFYDTRELAMKRLQQDVIDHKADGCVGMTVDTEIREVEYEINDTSYVDLLITMTALGSSIKKMKRPHKPIERKPLTVLNLASKSFVSIGSRTDELRGSIEDDEFMNDYD